MSVLERCSLFKTKRKPRPSNDRRKPIHSKRKRRFACYERQEGKCYYCNFDMLTEFHAQDDRRELLEQYNIVKSLLKTLVCTSEHLVQQHEGGTFKKENIAAACAFCNVSRPKLMSSDQYKNYVSMRVEQGTWHPVQRYSGIPTNDIRGYRKLSHKDKELFSHYR